MSKSEIVQYKEIIEAGRRLLCHAAEAHASRDVLLKISQKIDEYIVEYIRRSNYNEAKGCPSFLQEVGTTSIVQQAGSISPASLKRAETRNIFNNRKVFY